MCYEDAEAVSIYVNRRPHSIIKPFHGIQNAYIQIVQVDSIENNQNGDYT
jgi:hypothetical protein